MDQIKIGKFISKMRKEKHMTQMELAEKLSITDRAVSKWERGKSLPDASIMVELSSILGITTNELLLGEKLDEKNIYPKKDELILNLAKENEIKNKSLMVAMYSILIFSILLYMIIIITTINFVPNKLQSLIIIISTIIFLLFNYIGLKLELDSGYYECKYCHHKYIPKYIEVLLSMHIGTTRYLKCPKCHKYSYSKKVLK